MAKASTIFSLPGGVRLQVRHFAELTTQELYEILKARFIVFVGEQHIHYTDEDDIDYLATHFSLRRDGSVLAYARVFPDEEKGVFVVGRLLTIERGKGYARYLMEQIAAYAEQSGAHTLRLHAQIQVVPFYEQLGYHTVGDTFTEAEIIHILMEKQF